jgi:hypothetical protein
MAGVFTVTVCATAVRGAVLLLLLPLLLLAVP